MRRILALVFALSACAVLVSPCAAQVRPQPETEVHYRSLTAARVNPLGLVSFLEMTGRRRLYSSEETILTQNYAGIGITGGLSPAWGRVGVIAEVQPLSILRLYASYELVGYFSSFNLFASFPSATSEFSDTVIRQRTSQPGLGSYATYGAQLTLGGTLQMKIGPIAVRDLFRVAQVSFGMQRGDRVFYDQITDMLVPNDGWFLVNDVDVLALFDVGLAIGARWTYSHPFYTATSYAPTDDPSHAPNNDIHRLGLIAAYTFEDNHGARFDRPTLILIAQWHLVHRYRTGADVNVAAPYTALAFQFTGDLLSPR